MRGIHYLIVTLLVLTIGCAGNGASTDDANTVDTTYTEVSAMAAHATDATPERALLIIDSAEIVGNLQPYDAQSLRARVFCQSHDGKRLDTAIIICEQLMEEDSVRMSDTRTYDVLEVLVNACRMSRDDEGELRWATMLVDHCRKQGWDTEALRNEAEVGVILTHLGNRNEGLAKIDSALSRLDGIRKFNELDACIIAMKRKIVVLKESEGETQESAEMIIAVAQRMLERLADYEQHPDDYYDRTYREPTEEDRPGYIDFYRSQAWSCLAYAYAMMADNQINGQSDNRIIGRSDYRTIRKSEDPNIRKSKEYLDLFMQSDFGQTLNDRLLQGKSHLYAARFHAQEQQREIDRQHARMRHAQIIGTSIAIGAVLVLLFALYALRQWRKTQQHNRILALQITEASRIKTENSKLKTDNQISGHADNRTVRTSENPNIRTSIEYLIEHEQLFLNPNFDRQMLMDRTGLSKEQIGAAFSPSRFPTFVRELRLNHAVRLMNEQPDLSIEQICQASGFANADTFTRNFRTKYGMTPTTYLKSKI